VVKLLLNNPTVNPSSQNNEAIRKASKYGHTNVVKLLLKVGPSDRFPKRKRVDAL